MPEVGYSTISNIKENQRQRNSENIANVLIVDNDPELIRFMLEILASKGILGPLAGDKKEAIDFLEKNSCDLVFTGSTIGVRSNGRTRSPDGFELLQKIRENSPELPVFMTADTRERKEQEATEAL